MPSLAPVARSPLGLNATVRSATSRATLMSHDATGASCSSTKRMTRTFSAKMAAATSNEDSLQWTATLVNPRLGGFPRVDFQRPGLAQRAAV